MEKVFISDNARSTLEKVNDNDVIKAMQYPEKIVQGESMTWDALPKETKEKVNSYYMKKMQAHPNMSIKRLMKMCGKKFKLNFEIEE